MRKLILSVAVVLTALSVSTPNANADGGDAVVTVEIFENGDIEVTSTKDLSNVHIAVCLNGEVVITKFDSLEDKVEVFSVEGNLIAVLAHSGDNTKVEAEALLILLGGTVNGKSTGSIAFFDQEALSACQPPDEEEPPTTTTTTTVPPPTTTTTQPPTTITTQPPSTNPPTDTPPVVIHNCVTPDGFPFSTDVCPEPIPEASLTGTLPKTGSSTNLLAGIGLLALLCGLCMRLWVRTGRKA